MHIVLRSFRRGNRGIRKSTLWNHRLNKQSAGDQYQTESNGTTTLWKLIKKKAVSCNLHKQFPPLTLTGSMGLFSGSLVDNSYCEQQLSMR